MGAPWFGSSRRSGTSRRETGGGGQGRGQSTPRSTPLQEGRHKTSRSSLLGAGEPREGLLVICASDVHCSTVASVLVPRGTSGSTEGGGGREAVLVWAFLRRNDQLYRKIQRSESVLLQAILACILFNFAYFFATKVLRRAHIRPTCACNGSLGWRVSVFTTSQLSGFLR